MRGAHNYNAGAKRVSVGTQDAQRVPHSRRARPRLSRKGEAGAGHKDTIFVGAEGGPAARKTRQQATELNRRTLARNKTRNRNPQKVCAHPRCASERGH